MLLDGVGELDERLELLRRGRVLTEPVLAQAEQLAHRAGVGIGVAQRAQQPRRVALASGRERLGGARELGLGVTRAAAREAGELVAGLGRAQLAAPDRRRRPAPCGPASGRGAGAVAAAGRRTLRNDGRALAARRRRRSSFLRRNLGVG